VCIKTLMREREREREVLIQPHRSENKNESHIGNNLRDVMCGGEEREM